MQLTWNDDAQCQAHKEVQRARIVWVKLDVKLHRLRSIQGHEPIAHHLCTTPNTKRGLMIVWVKLDVGLHRLRSVQGHDPVAHHLPHQTQSMG
eukprot:1159559-Pelagomonas_calceolata.AAC.7